jgi:hypothetical protein
MGAPGSPGVSAPFVDFGGALKTVIGSTGALPPLHTGAAGTFTRGTVSTTALSEGQSQNEGEKDDKFH